MRNTALHVPLASQRSPAGRLPNIILGKLILELQAVNPHGPQRELAQVEIKQITIPRFGAASTKRFFSTKHQPRRNHRWWIGPPSLLHQAHWLKRLGAFNSIFLRVSKSCRLADHGGQLFIESFQNIFNLDLRIQNRIENIYKQLQTLQNNVVNCLFFVYLVDIV